MGKKKSQTQKTESKTENNPWAPAQDQLKDILSEAQKEYEKTGGLDGNWIDKNYPDLTDDMKSALQNMASSGNLQNVANQINNITSSGASNVNNASNALGGMTSGGITGQQVNELAGQLYDSDTVKSQTAQLAQDVNQAYEGQVNQLNQQATASGNMGSSRAGVAQGVMSGKANEALAKGTADIQNTARTNAYNQALGTLQGNQQTNLNAANSLGQLGMNQGQLAAGSQSIYQQMLENQFGAANIGQTQEQNKALNDYFNQYGQSQAGWQNLQNYLNMVGSIGGMGGTSNSTGKTTASGGGGGMFGNILGAASTGAGVIGAGAQAGWWSDASMKKNVKKTGETADGTSTYDWEWNESGKKQGMKGKGSGVLAQQVMKDKPEAVVKDKKTGALAVDYDKVGVKPKNSKRKRK
ncbi:hypothetical protein ECO319P1_00090 [Escherichia phage ECO319P1]|nr:hypothetical protein ECO319P1_00090 [Escherichia phage ECO319P1]